MSNDLPDGDDTTDRFREICSFRERCSFRDISAAPRDLDITANIACAYVPDEFDKAATAHGSSSSASPWKALQLHIYVDLLVGCRSFIFNGVAAIRRC